MYIYVKNVMHFYKMEKFDAERIRKELKAGEDVEIYLNEARTGKNPYAKQDVEITDKQNKEDEPKRIENRQSEDSFVRIMQLQKDLRSPDSTIRDEAARKLPEEQEQYFNNKNRGRPNTARVLALRPPRHRPSVKKKNKGSAVKSPSKRRRKHRSRDALLEYRLLQEYTKCEQDKENLPFYSLRRYTKKCTKPNVSQRRSKRKMKKRSAYTRR